MNLLDALFAGAKALLKEIAVAGRAIIREVLKEVDQSAFGRAATRLIDGMMERYFSKAQDLADEEQELSAKAQRDGRRNEADTERLREIEVEREELRAKMERANAQRSAQEFKVGVNEAIVATIDDDELSSNVGILSAKPCPACGGTMRIRQGAIINNTSVRNFFWQCTEPNNPPCPSIKLDPAQMQASVIRPADPDLDTPKAERRAAWKRDDILMQTHGRVRHHLGDEDKQMVCPNHLLPMRLLPKRSPGNLLLDSYEYVCLGVTADGKACDHKIDLQTMPQVAAMLRRTEGKGILSS